MSEPRGCRICEAGRPSDIIAELDTSWVTAPTLAPLPAYVCIVAKSHVEEPYELGPLEAQSYWSELLSVARAVQGTSSASRINYEIHGNTIPHLHTHLYPRYPGDPFEGRPIDGAARLFERNADELAALVVPIRALPGALVRPRLVGYQPDWPDRAARLVEELQTALDRLADRIEHIGSTAIPDMEAKDVLDVQVSVQDLAVADAAFDRRLGPLGFMLSSYQRDHVPAGRNDPTELWSKRLWTRRHHPRGDVNLHVRRTGSPNERLALLFRDWFRAHPHAVPAYAQFKRHLASLAPDLDSYADTKDPVVDVVIVAAEDWAASVGWSP